MKSDHDSRLKELEEKLDRIDRLEKDVAPSGVSFAVIGQEKVSTDHDVPRISDSLEAADAAIEVLESRKAILAELEESGAFGD